MRIVITLLTILALMLSGCSGSLTLEETEEVAVITEYLDNEIISPNFGGKIFSSHHLLGTGTDEIYLWAIIQEYYLDGQNLVLGTGLSAPHVLQIKSDEFKITGHLVARDGSYYGEDIRGIFPQSLHNIIFSFPSSGQTQIMSDTIEEKAKQWFMN